MTTHQALAAICVLLALAVCASGQNPPPFESSGYYLPPADAPYGQPQAQPVHFDVQQGQGDPPLGQVVPATAHEPLVPARIEPPPVPARTPVPLAPQGAGDAHREHDRMSKSHASPRSSGWPATLASLALVLGLFLLTVWTLRRAMPASMQRLPAEVVEVLGQVPLTARQQANLIRLGNKLVLVSVSTGGADPLVEITDAVEVDRLTALCKQASPYSSTTAFRQVLAQFSGESEATSWWDRLRGKGQTAVRGENDV